PHGDGPAQGVLRPALAGHPRRSGCETAAHGPGPGRHPRFGRRARHRGSLRALILLSRAAVGGAAHGARAALRALVVAPPERGSARPPWRVISTRLALSRPPSSTDRAHGFGP